MNRIGRAYMPSKRENLEAHYSNLQGLPCYTYSICEELTAEGLLREIFPGELDPNIFLRGWVITTRGKLVVEFIRGESEALSFITSNWVRIAASRKQSKGE